MSVEQEPIETLDPDEAIAEHQPRGASEMIDEELYDIPENIELGID